MMILLVLALLFAVLEWFAESRQHKTGIFLTKPTAMVLLITWVLLTGDDVWRFPLMWFVIGLILCLGGDIFLMLPPERFFLPGLISFLLGHIFYIIGFGQAIPTPWVSPLGVVIAFGLLITSGLIYHRLAKGMLASGNTRMRIPVAVYAIIISIMLYSAVLTNLTTDWLSSHAILVSVGALLFFISDILNAWTRFVSPFSNDRLWTMSSYHLAQIAIAVGATLHFTI